MARLSKECHTCRSMWHYSRWLRRSRMEGEMSNISRCSRSRIYWLALRIWNDESWLVSSWCCICCTGTTPPYSYAISRAHWSTPWCTREGTHRHNSRRSQICIFCMKWNRSKWVSNQTCKNVYEEIRIYRRSKRISWKDYGVTLNDREKGLSWACMTTLWMTSISCTILRCWRSREATWDLWDNRSWDCCCYDGANPVRSRGYRTTRWFLATNQSCDQEAWSTPHCWRSTDWYWSHRETLGGRPLVSCSRYYDYGQGTWRWRNADLSICLYRRNLAVYDASKSFYPYDYNGWMSPCV